MKVFVYKNLHRNCWSIKALDGEHRGKVVAYSNFAHVSQPQFKVSESGRERVLREQQKNVHAGVVGELGGVSDDVKWRYNVSLPEVTTLAATQHDWIYNILVKVDGSEAVTYNPYKYRTFVRQSDERPVTAARVASMFPTVVVASGLRFAEEDES